eukprot:142077_1
MAKDPEIITQNRISAGGSRSVSEISVFPLRIADNYSAKRTEELFRVIYEISIFKSTNNDTCISSACNSGMRNIAFQKLMNTVGEYSTRSKLLDKVFAKMDKMFTLNDVIENKINQLKKTYGVKISKQIKKQTEQTITIAQKKYNKYVTNQQRVEIEKIMDRSIPKKKNNDLPLYTEKPNEESNNRQNKSEEKNNDLQLDSEPHKEPNNVHNKWKEKMNWNMDCMVNVNINPGLETGTIQVETTGKTRSGRAFDEYLFVSTEILNNIDKSENIKICKCDLYYRNASHRYEAKQGEYRIHIGSDNEMKDKRSFSIKDKTQNKNVFEFIGSKSDHGTTILLFRVFETLEHYVERHRSLSELQTKEIIMKVLNKATERHFNKLIMTPNNIYIDTEGDKVDVTVGENITPKDILSKYKAPELKKHNSKQSTSKALSFSVAGLILFCINGTHPNVNQYGILEIPTHYAANITNLLTDLSNIDQQKK